MKKLIILCSFLLCGCSGVLQGNLVNTCTKVSNSTGLIDTTTYEIHFKEDIISEISITYQYEGDTNVLNTLKTSYDSQNNYLKDYEELQIQSELTDKYIISYKVDMTKLSDVVKDKFNLVEERSKQVNKLKDLGFTCD